MSLQNRKISSFLQLLFFFLNFNNVTRSKTIFVTCKIILFLYKKVKNAIYGNVTIFSSSELDNLLNYYNFPVD